MLRSAVFTLVAGAIAAFPAVSFAECNYWNFAADYLATGSSETPMALDSCGSAVWEFKDSVDLTFAPTNYAPLTEFLGEYAQCTPTGPNKIWTTPYGQPHISVNASGVDEACGVSPINFLADAAIMHPGPASAAVLAWKSPIPGEVTVTFAAADIHDLCGDGVDWFVQTPSAQYQGSFGNGLSGGWQGVVKVKRGEYIYFGVGPGAASDFLCDTTAVDVTITR